MAHPLSLCVYCGSRPGQDPAHAQAADRLGQALGQRRWRLVYGGGRVGLMGRVADAALAAGAQVTGIIPDSLMRREVDHPGVQTLEVVPDMHIRKRRMAEEADAFLALPGGIGTLEELFEVWTWQHLGYHQKPVGLLNVAGYYNGLLAFIQQMQAQGFIDARQTALLIVGDHIDELLDRLAAARSHEPGDYALI